MCKPDKGQGVATLDEVDYLAKFEALLADRFVFKPVEKNNNIQNLAKFQNFYAKKNNPIRPVLASIGSYIYLTEKCWKYFYRQPGIQ